MLKSLLVLDVKKLVFRFFLIKQTAVQYEKA